MRVETRKDVNVEHPRLPATKEVVLRDKNTDSDGDRKKTDDGKIRGGLQHDKQKLLIREKEEEEDEGEEEKKEKEKEKEKEKGEKEQEEEKENVSLTNMIKLMKEKYRISDEDNSDVISRSPMRFHDCHQSAKPYEYPYNVSRVYGGVTRVVEADTTNPALYRRLYTTLQSPNGTTVSEGHVGDVDLCDINLWLNLCKRDPKLLSDFVEDCQNEFSKKEISNPFEYRSNSNLCSSVSSQFASPVQSPSERSLTSPESVGTYEENSLYYSASPSVPCFDGLNIKPDEKDVEKALVSPKLNKSDACTSYPFPYPNPNLNPNGNVDPNAVAQNDRVKNEVSGRPGDSVTNIGTVMLNLAEDPYESTIDLNQFSTVCDTTAEQTTSKPSRTERDSLNEKLERKAKENAWARISQLNIDLLGKGDKDGDTQLMILLVSEKVTLEYVYVIVERLLNENPEYLSCRNELNQDALYLAAFKLVREPLVVSYLAEALVRGKQEVDRKYDGGNTLIHCLARKGDSHAKVLERLVKLKDSEKVPLFGVNKKNNKGFTPLHVACEAHKKDVLHAYQTVKILVEHGADPTAKDYKDENTPLHILTMESCDVDLLRIVLESESQVPTRNGGSNPTVICNRQGNTPLHLSCGRNTLGLQQQKDAIRLLLRHGAMIQQKNINGFVPSVLVSSTRKQEIKSILHSHRQK